MGPKTHIYGRTENNAINLAPVIIINNSEWTWTKLDLLLIGFLICNKKLIIHKNIKQNIRFIKHCGDCTIYSILGLLKKLTF